MADLAALSLPENPKLVANMTHFARALRRAGLPIGPGRIAEAVQAVTASGFTRREDFFWTLQACYVSRPEHRQVFAQVFRLFWRDPRYLEHMMAAMLPAIRGVQEEKAPRAGEKRAAEALLDGAEAQGAPPDPGQVDQEESEFEVKAARTISARERLMSLDFEQMSTAEMAEAKRILSTLELPVRPIATRRLEPAALGARLDWRRTMRRAARTGGALQALARSRPRHRWPNLVVICDISGSMSDYSRMILHFLHTVANKKGQGWARVHGFTFGTELTNISRHLATRDVDAALASAGAQAQDWQGGTRIGACLHDFNRDWSRRVLGQGAVVLLVSDGLDRDDPNSLSKEMQRLQRSCRRLIWLNPLLRWQEFAPRAQGIRAMLPHVDSFRAGHSIASLTALASVLSRPDDVGEKARLLQML